MIAAILCVLAAGVVLWPLYQTGFQPAIGDGKTLDSYQFDLSNLSIPRGLLVPAAAKDGIRAIPSSLEVSITPLEVELRNRNEREEGQFLVPSDRVIGVEIGGESRAYPLHVLNYHEVANDVLAGTPIAVTYSPLCDAAMVFDRRIDADAKPVEFGVSGLLYDSDSVLFDRRGKNREESLWPQLLFQAVSGPALGKRLRQIPFELTTWKAWVKAHPATRVVEGLRNFTQQYKMEPYSNYFSTDELKFPVSPMWSRPGIPRKTDIVTTSGDGGKSWTAQLASEAPAGPAKAGEIRLYAFVFAWYAQHQHDTDYSAISRTP
jgi:hypothetical protein